MPGRRRVACACSGRRARSSSRSSCSSTGRSRSTGSARPTSPPRKGGRRLPAECGRGGRRRRPRRGRGGFPAAPDADRRRLGNRASRRGHAAEEHVLLPEADERAALPAAVTDWLGLCRASVSDVRTGLEQLPTRAEREPVVGKGLGGDETTAVDKAAEDAILAHLRGLDVTVVSEEAGRLGTGSTVVVVDPIDGSLNAKRGIPFFSVSIAVADGERMGDVHFAYVYDFGTGAEWVARRGEGATLNGEQLRVRPKDRIEILSFEATRASLIARDAPKVAELAYRLRIMGSLALSLCHLAAGRVDAVCSLKGARSVDIAAAQLLVRECGLAIDLPEAPPFDRAPLDTVGRSRVVAAGTPKLCQELFAALDS